MTRTPIPNCPQPETPIRERAWADGQRPEPKYSDAEIHAIANEACRYDNSRYQPWSDSGSPHYGDAEHFVRRVLAALASRPSTPDKAGVSGAVGRLREIAYRDEMKWVIVRADDLRAALTRFASRSAEAVRDRWRDPDTAPVSTPMHQFYFLANCPNDDWSPGGNVHFACYYGDQGRCRPTGTNGSRAFNGWMPIPPALKEQSHD